MDEGKLWTRNSIKDMTEVGSMCSGCSETWRMARELVFLAADHGASDERGSSD